MSSKKNKLMNSLILFKLIQNEKNFVDYSLNNCDSENEWYRLSGQLDALSSIASFNKKRILSKITETKLEINELYFENESYDFHLEYLKGYLKGFENALKFEKISSNSNQDIRIIMYAVDRELCEILKIFFISAGFVFSESLSDSKTFFISSNIEKITSLSYQFDAIKLIFVLNKSKSRKFNYDKKFKEDVEKSEDCLKNIAPIEKDSEIELFESFKFFNDQWLNASFVYIPSVLSIQRITTDVLKSLRF